MKFKQFTKLLTVGVLLTSLVGCSTESQETNSDEDKTIVVGTTSSPGGEIFEYLEPLIEEKGYELEIEIFNDYILPNTALNDGDLDANLFQHTDFLNRTIAETGYDITSVVELYGVPSILYSDKVKSIDELKEGDVLAISNDPSQSNRLLQFLESQGLITLGESELYSIKDIVDSPKGIEIIEVDPAMMANTLPDVEAAFIDANFAISAGLDASEQGILINPAQEQYYNILVCSTEDKEDEKIKVLQEVLTSDEARDFMNEQFKGAIIPVF